MIRLIEALNYRCLKHVRQELGPFHVLVGPNASGKTTFLDVVAFLGQLVSDGLEAAVGARSQNFEDLVWRRSSENVPKEPGSPPKATSFDPRYAVPDGF